VDILVGTGPNVLIAAIGFASEKTEKPLKVSLEKVLEEINQAREILGWEKCNEIPKGKMDSTLFCPISKALRGRVTSRRVYFKKLGRNQRLKLLEIASKWYNGDTELGMWDGFTGLDLTAHMWWFLHRFDRGKYPGLVSPKEPGKKLTTRIYKKNESS